MCVYPTKALHTDTKEKQKSDLYLLISPNDF